jgi:hypothetical protein
MEVMQDTEFDDPDLSGIADDELPGDDEELGALPAPASAVPAEPVPAS